MVEFVFIKKDKYFSRRYLISNELFKKYKKRYSRGKTANGIEKVKWNLFMLYYSQKKSYVECSKI